MVPGRWCAYGDQPELAKAEEMTLGSSVPTGLSSSNYTHWSNLPTEQYRHLLGTLDTYKGLERSFPLISEHKNV